jgi:hypothetical protein
MDRGVLSCSRTNVTDLRTAHRPPSRSRSAFMSSCFHVLSVECVSGAAFLLTEESPYSKKFAGRRFGPKLFFGHSGPRDAPAAAAISEAATFPEAPIPTSARRWPGFEPRAALPAAPCPESPRREVAVVRLGSGRVGSD